MSTKAELERENAEYKATIETLNKEIIRLNGIIKDASPQNHPDFIALQAAYQKLEAKYKALTTQLEQIRARKREHVKRLDDDTKAQIVELRAQGLTIRAIADTVGCSKSTVHNYLKTP